MAGSKPSKESQAFTVRLPAGMHRLLKEVAFYAGTSVNELIVGSLDEAQLAKLRDAARAHYEKR